jgi:hypothetical protein
MTRKKTKVERDLKKTVRDLSAERTKILDEFATAFMIENGALPSQIELREVQTASHVSWHFALRPQPSKWNKLKSKVSQLRLKITK